MANKILIIGVGSAGVIAADKMNLPNSKKLFGNTRDRSAFHS
jgi:cell division GTPase FtsZ